MRLFVILILIATSSATFHKLKPHKLYKTLVEPFVNLALKGVVLDPIGQWFTRGGKKSKHKNQGFIPYQHYGGPSYHHEKDVYFHYGGGGVPPYQCSLHGGYHPEPFGHFPEPLYPLLTHENAFYPSEALHHGFGHYAEHY